MIDNCHIELLVERRATVFGSNLFSNSNLAQVLFLLIGPSFSHLCSGLKLSCLLGDDVETGAKEFVELDTAPKAPTKDVTASLLTGVGCFPFD